MPFTPVTPASLADALESGDYAKGIDCLHDVVFNTYCCLGVAARLAGYSAEELTGSEVVAASFMSDSGPVRGTDDLIPPSWALWLTGPLQAVLAELNDTADNLDEDVACDEDYKNTFAPVIAQLRSL